MPPRPLLGEPDEAVTCRTAPAAVSIAINCRYWFFPGSAMGVPAGTNVTCRTGTVPGTACDADDARALNATALTVANFRQAAAPLPAAGFFR